MIHAGSATVTRGGKVGNRVGPYDLIGELALLDHSARTATVVADNTIQATLFDPREFASLLDAPPRLRTRVLQVADQRRRR